MKRVSLLGAALLIGILVLWRQQREIARHSQEFARLRFRSVEVSNQLVAAEIRTAELRAELDRANAERSFALAELARLGRPPSPTPTDPASAWNSPPESLPDWNPESPFVWLDKSVLPKLHVNAFTPDGSLAPGLGAVLTLDQQDEQVLNRELTRVVAEYRRQEVAHTRLVDAHLPQIAQQEGRKLTLRVDPMPEVCAQLRQEFEEALVRNLGSQRAHILGKAATGWISEMFPDTQTNPRIISIALDPNGEHHIALQNGIGTMAASGPGEYINYIPPHLRHLLADFQKETPEVPAR